jgi:hypothetical protein
VTLSSFKVSFERAGLALAYVDARPDPGSFLKLRETLKMKTPGMKPGVWKNPLILSISGSLGASAVQLFFLSWWFSSCTYRRVSAFIGG